MDQIPQTQLDPEVRTGEGLSVRRVFTLPGAHPFDLVEWELRDARIGHGDKVSFEQRDVEFPDPGPRTPPTSSPRSTSVASLVPRRVSTPSGR